jgi:CheY-like chemotaxis protein
MSEVVAIISDLIFRSRVEGEARAAGTSVVSVQTAAEAAKRIGAGCVGMLIVDLDLSASESAEAIRAAREAGVDHIVAFYPHAQTQLAQQAKEAGANTVLPRSSFVVRLPELLDGMK